MQPKRQDELNARVARTAEAALADHQYVSVIDVLAGMGLLSPRQVETWKQGRIDFLEEAIQRNPNKIRRSLELFREWALGKGLTPSEVRYVRASRTGEAALRFTQSGDAESEKFFRTHYLSSALPERKRQRIKEKLNRPPAPVVFQVASDTACSECGTEIWKGDCLVMEAGQPLCLACARLDDLEWLAAGDAAMTRRATKYSDRTAVVVRFSRSRGRYERQGILVTELALERAERECAEDAGKRARDRAAGAERRKEEDRDLVAEMTARIANLFPGCPPQEASAIAAHTSARGSGCVGRTAAGRQLEERAMTVAVHAAVRHRHTKYDEMLAAGVTRSDAREKVAGRVQEVLESWRR
jgi:hypothetical protein